MTNPDIHETIKRQRAFFATGRTKDVSFRIDQLRRLRAAILEREEQLYEAFWQDLRKPRYEVYMTEIGPVLKEITHFIGRLRCWSRPRLRITPMEHLPALSFTIPEPLGVALIISPWNYPFNLLMGPLLGAMAAGNCAVLKAGNAAAKVAAVLGGLIEAAFTPDYVALFRGGREVNTALLEERYDSIFFTGSTGLGRVVMGAAARHLTPVTLELGGKSPVIVHKDANLKIAAQRIMWGKLLNSGQTCIAPDYLLVHSEVRERLFALMQQAVSRLYSPNPQTSEHYGRIVNDEHFNRLLALLESGDVAFGGSSDADDRYIAPTLLENVALDDPVMEEEIFGPILPAIEFESLDETLDIINERPKPLALYVFTGCHKSARKVLRQTSSGGACVNDVMMHIANSYLPFGGVGASGIGAYHGRASFDTFTHEKSVFKNVTWLDLPLRYAPYSDLAYKVVKLVLR